MKPKHKAARKNHPQANGTSEPKASETGAAKANMQPSDNKAAQSAETKPAAPSAHYVSLKDVMDALTPEQRQETLAWFTAVGCPDNIAAQLTPEQRAQRERYRAEKWAEYDAKWKEFEESEPKPAKRYGEAIDTLNDFMEQEEWFAKNTPHPFRIQHWPRIANLAQFLCDDLQRLARFGNQEAIRTVARISVETTETLTELLNSESEAAIQNAKLMQYEAAELPYWPMLQFRNKAANNHFARVADNLQLGCKCQINVSELANYSLETPINRFVWKNLRHFQKVHRSIRYHMESSARHHPEKPKTFEEAIEWIVFQRVEAPPARKPYIAGMIHREEIPIYKRSLNLPPLRKSTAKQWADVAIMARLEIIKFDYLGAPEFERIRSRKRVKSHGTARAEVRKDIIRALQSLARPAEEAGKTNEPAPRAGEAAVVAEERQGQ